MAGEWRDCSTRAAKNWAGQNNCAGAASRSRINVGGLKVWLLAARCCSPGLLASLREHVSGAEAAVFANPCGFLAHRLRPAALALDQSRTDGPDWRRQRRAEERICAERFIKRRTLQQARSPGEPSADQAWRGAGYRNLGVHEAFIAARATVGGESQEMVERLFKRAAGVGFPN
jgi:hypothetical protein